MPRNILNLRFFLLLILLLPGFLLLGQLNGMVRDMESGIPLQGAQIMTDEAISVSDDKGLFTLDAPPGTKLHISHIGYLSDSIHVRREQQFVTVFLSPAAYHLKQVVVRSPLLHDKQMSMPSSIAVLNQKDLSHSDNISYIETLNQVSGVYVHKGSMTTSRITVRGMGARTPYATNRIKAYYNEIPLSSGDGNTLIEDIDPGFIQSISLIKGAKSAMYGSGIGGVLLLSGKSYFEEGVSGGLAMEGGNFNTLKPNAWIHYRKNDFSLSSGYSYVQSDGFRENSAYDRQNAHVYLSLNKEKLELSFLLHFIDVHGFIPSSLNEETFHTSPEKSASNWLSVKGFESYSRVLSGLKSRYFLSGSLSNTTVLYGSFLDAYESRPFNILDDQSMQLGLKSYFTYQKGALTMRSGVDYLHERYHWSLFETLGGTQGDELNRFRETRHPLSVFIQMDLLIDPGWVIEAGLSYNTTRYRLFDLIKDSGELTGEHAFNPTFSPFVGINRAFSEQFNLYASIGHGFSLPSVEETLLPDGQINPDLKPESGINYEAGARYQSKDNDLFIDLSTYLMSVKDLLLTKRISEAVFYGDNAGKTRHMGLELMGGYRFNRERRFSFPVVRLNLSLTLSQNTFKDFVDDGVSYKGNSIPGIPGEAFTTNLGFWFRKGAYLDIHYRYSGAQFMNDSNTESYPGYHYTAIKTGKPFSITRDAKIEVYLGINNLLNTSYASMILINAPSFGGAAPRYYYPGTPRYFYTGFRFIF